MKLLAATAIMLSLFASASAQTNQAEAASGSQAPGPQSIRIMRRGSQPSRRGPAENFTGSVRVDPLFQASAPARASGSLVTFEPGARSAWHTHPLGQVLIVTAGTGRVQRWGDPVDEIRQGDVVWIPPGQEHWHGAAPNSSMAHIAVVEALDGKAVEWMEKVSDAQYGAPLRAQGASTDAGARPRPSQAAIGDFAPKLAELTDDVLYGDVWERSELSKRDRSLVTVSALIAMNRPDQLITAAFTTSANAQDARKNRPGPLTIQEQGSFAVGGSVTTAPGTFDPIKQGAFNPAGPDPAGQTLHGDHAYVFYQVPVNARKLPLVFWHGHGQSAKTWETTPDGREGFQNIFLRRRFPVYLIDQPRRGRAARSTQPVNITAAPDEQLWFGIFRLGAWPNFYPGVQFSRDPEALNQFFRQMVPNTGPYDARVNIEAVSALFDKVGPGILVTHSQSGGPGWHTAMRNRNVRAVVAFEPGGDFPFPEGEAQSPIILGGREVRPPTVPLSEFMRLTKIPVRIYYGDNIPEKPSANPGQEQWRVFLEVAGRWRDALNRRGGNVTLVHLPEIGVRGNTHFPMSDMNNLEIADLMSKFLKEKGLD